MPAAISELAIQVTEAAKRIRPVVVETPVEQIDGLGLPNGVELFFKLEHLQQTGSFKLRGASNKILSLSASQAAKGVIAASNGNHGLGVAAAARRAGIAAEVYVSMHVSPSKVRRIEEYGAGIIRIGNDPLEAELAARAAASAQDKVFISPYNDLVVMAGQGTIAVELLRQLPSLDALFVAVGGGGLIGGIGAYIKCVSRKLKWSAAGRKIRLSFMSQLRLGASWTFPNSLPFLKARPVALNRGR